MVQTESAVAPEYGLTARLQASRPHLSKSMTKLAQLLVDEPELPILLSINELADRAGVSAPTVTRFCRLLGYAGYVPLRVSAAADLGRSSAQNGWFTEIERIEPETPAAEISRSLLAVTIQSLQTGADLFDIADIQQLARRIATSRHVDIYGVGSSLTVAQKFQELLYNIGINAHFFGEIHAGLMSASLLDDQSVAVAISSTGRTRETCEMLAQAGQQGALTAAITSDPQSVLAATATIKIRTAPPHQAIAPTHLGALHIQLFACELVYLLVAQFCHEQTQRAIALTVAAIDEHRSPSRNHPIAKGDSIG